MDKVKLLTKKDEQELEKEFLGEEQLEEEKAKKYSCECIECGHKVRSENHCKDIKCPECGGEMRRAGRPGPGRSADIEYKQFSIEEFKAEEDDDGAITIEGYANVKNKKDRFGDVPTVFGELRNYVYELKEFKKNPVMLLNHLNNTGAIAGSFNPKLGGSIKEDEKGLKFKAIFSKSDHRDIKHARTVYKEGHGRALSIAGKWYHEDKDHPEHLTLAEIMEVSLVGVGADSNALTDKSKPLLPEKGQPGNPQEIEESKAGRVLSKANEGKLRKAQEFLTEVLKTLEKEEDRSWTNQKTIKITR